ncbi:MAG TPA: fused MFS/spermidine synthase [Verrucomicrobiota bacterium]|nr:fused MFS/spermidine synthase [Verrucomicrobiota bacterium]
MRSRNLSWLILLLFFCSGATALVYEVVWSKLLSQLVGSTVYAQTIVLAVFMGGLALGNRLFGRLADRLRQPVQMYGILEIGIGLYAVLFPSLDRLADWIFIRLGTSIADKAGLLLLLKGVLSAGLLLGPTILMGGTLPLMASWLQRFTTEGGRRSARFYSINSLGAVFGSWLAGFFLVQRFGMPTTLVIAAVVNLAIGAAAIFASRSGWLGKPAAVETSTSSKPSIAAPGTLRMAGLIVAVTGGVSMGLEVLASRSLGMVFGSSLQSFAIVLMAFILGIGLGSAWIASPKRQIRSSEGMIVLLLCLAAGWMALLVFNIENWVDFYRLARTGLNRTDVGYTYNLLLNSAIALVILGLPAGFIGAVLPLMIRAVSRAHASLGEQVGWLLTWNTLGAVVGVLFTGFVLMPIVGLRNAFGVLTLMLAGVALLIARQHRFKGATLGAGIVCLSICSLFLFGTEGWQHVISSGVFREAAKEYDPQAMAKRKAAVEIIYYKDAPDATVGVEKTSESLVMTINGKPDASSHYKDFPTQMLLAHLPMLARPEAKDIFLLGLGSGITAGALLGHPINQLVLAENCAPVIEAAGLFDSWNRDALDDPRTHLLLEDGRTVLKLYPHQYDVIITAPSNPWSAGVGSVFSQDFYKLAAARLKPGGLMVQWFQMYEMQDDIVLLLLRTFRSVFPYMEIWDATGGDIIMIGSMQPWATGPAQFRKAFQVERVRDDLRTLDLLTPEMVMARQLASQRTAPAIPGPGPVQTDMSPVLEYAAPRALFLSQFCTVMERYDERTFQQLLAPPEKLATLRSLSPEAVRLVFGSFATINAELFHVVFGGPRGVNVPCVFQTGRSAPPPAGTGSVYDIAAQQFAAGNVIQARQLVAQVLQANPRDEQAAYLARVFDLAIGR